jgi:hypothetical protein
MGFASDFKFAVNVIVAPGKNAKKSLTVGSALKIYYEASILPFLLSILVGILLWSIGVQSIALPFLNSFTGFGMVTGIIIAVAVSMWIFVPIGLFINAFLYQIVGKYIFNAWNGNYEKTFAASMFAILPQTFLYWLLAIPVLSIIILAILVVWDLIILIIGLSVQQKTSRVNAFVVIFATILLVMAVAMILVLAATMSVVPSLPVGTSTLHPI